MALVRLVRARSLELWRARRYYRVINRILFRAGDPAGRYRIMQRFYGLSQRLIRRFYAADLSLADRVRILVGRPPVSMASALIVALKLRWPL
jgi:lycopene beta-cyclase